MFFQSSQILFDKKPSFGVLWLTVAPPTPTTHDPIQHLHHHWSHSSITTIVPKPPPPHLIQPENSHHLPTPIKHTDSHQAQSNPTPPPPSVPLLHHHHHSKTSTTSPNPKNQLPPPLPPSSQNFTLTPTIHYPANAISCTIGSTPPTPLSPLFQHFHHQYN
ncbi:hypothetical protein O181_069320 [Austropuccinia psidii MF-1]|uniref:Uncharacterized protein n=1 Tax=Austropuccinia psidii MF-1 TaxID=1389203 RepID=A0A9Q3EU99_9BASI|nr:hypothetical protein [Austropuccinia psidii MF-1]